VTGTTALWLRPDPLARLAAAEVFELRGGAAAPPRSSARLCVLCVTSDGEEVPVKKKLLRPCITLTAQVLEDRGRYREAFETARDAGVLEGDAPVARVAVDCCAFDRVLLYLEAAAADADAAGGASAAAAVERFVSTVLDLPTAEELLEPAQRLGCAGLEELCAVALGAMEARVRPGGIPWDEVAARNKTGEVILVIDGMVFDVTRWLPHHPGGAAIIPKQALSMDSARFFEIYHAGNEPFKYLKEFYCGDIVPSDMPRVPRPEAAPSPEFLEILAEWTSWRVTPVEAKDVVHKSF
jgi:cytochrome b involved in lipid metabolism